MLDTGHIGHTQSEDSMVNHAWFTVVSPLESPTRNMRLIKDEDYFIEKKNGNCLLHPVF